MNHPFPHLPGENVIAYVREVGPGEIPEGMAEGKVYAIHDASGKRLALAASRDMAFAVVRRNDMVPVSVH